MVFRRSSRFPSLICPLCSQEIENGHHSIDGHVLFKCSKCFLLFKDPQSWPDLEVEKAIYDLHQNDPENPRYREYLLKTLSPVLERIPKAVLGLDYGCGPSKGIESLCRERGIDCFSFDPLYFPQDEVFEHKFDFIIVNEVAEHFQKPGHEFEKINSLLKPQAIIGLRTELPPQKLEGWWYMKDPTHIVFYSIETLNFIAESFSLNIVVQEGPITLFERK